MEKIEPSNGKLITPEDIETVLNDLQGDIQNTFDTTSAQSEFTELVKNLHEKKMQLTKTVKDLENTKNALRHELGIRKHTEAKLIEVLTGLDEEREKISATVEEGKQKLTRIRDEEEKIRML